VLNWAWKYRSGNAENGRTPTAPPPRGGCEDLTQYLERLLQAERFRKSPSLRQLLEYLVRKCAEGSADDIKESTIAMDVFGRPTSFDSRLDNSVRVQDHRLRKTLESTTKPRRGR